MNWKKGKKFLLVFCILGFIAGFFGYRYIYKDHDTIQELSTEYSGTAKELLNKVSENPENWNNKIVEISGLVTKVNATSITINSSVFCQLDPSNSKTINQQDKAKIKGRIIGFDDLLMELKMDQTIVLSK
ncbi:MAG: hypothetical protein N4A45_00270 [Flavobacteriales bacterium]|jgi:predicted negative regulator of RcsB-dependent stress response|nr:hypothetical protein [Flavobacteriales bacterium]